jgi:AraC-type DNA-binding domain-containing proteins
MNMLWSPAFYLYVLLMTGIIYRPQWKDVIHLIPLIISLAVITPMLFLPNDDFSFVLESSKRTLPWQFNLVNMMLALQCIIYVTLSYIKLRRYNNEVKNLFSDIQKISVFWLQGLITTALVLFVTIFPPIIYFQKLDYFLYFLPIGLNCIYLFLVFKTLSSPILFTPKIREVLSLKNEIDDKLKITARSLSTKVPDPQLSMIAERLVCFFEEHKPYLNPELNIKLLSEQIGILIHPMSAALNQQIGMNFYDFVNSYRIKYAINLLNEQNAEKYKIDFLVQESGFKSRSVFYSAFKKETGCTPSEFRQVNIKKDI